MATWKEIGKDALKTAKETGEGAVNVGKQAVGMLGSAGKNGNGILGMGTSLLDWAAKTSARVATGAVSMANTITRSPIGGRIVALGAMALIASTIVGWFKGNKRRAQQEQQDNLQQRLSALKADRAYSSQVAGANTVVAGNMAERVRGGVGPQSL